MNPRLALCLCGLVAQAAGCVRTPDEAAGTSTKTASSAAPPPRAVDNGREHLEALDPLPNTAVAGPDADNDHIRDDIAEFIDEQWGGNERKRLSARQFARANEHGLVFGADKDRAMDAGDENMRAVECLYAYYSSEEADAISAEVEARTVDTEERLHAYVQWQRSMSGGYFQGARDTKQSCAFDQGGLAP